MGLCGVNGISKLKKSTDVLCWSMSFWPGTNHSDLIACYLVQRKGLDVYDDIALYLHLISWFVKNINFPYPQSGVNEHVTQK